MSHPPRVSVVIPAYNHESYVDEAIRSVLEQSWRDLELLVIDDGSTDHTLRHCSAWAQRDPRVTVLTQENQGSHATINRGVGRASADLVMILNSDDRWAPDRLSRVLREFEDPAVSFVVTGCSLIDADGRRIDDPDHWWHRAQQDFIRKARALGAFEGLLYGNYTVSTSNFAFRRRLWQTVGPIRPMRMIPDWDWAIRAAIADPKGLRFLVEEELLHYRLHGRNAILSNLVRGDLEVGWLHRRMLRELQVPHGAVSALFRNQRDLRRHARRLGQEPMEELLQRKQTELGALADTLQRAEGFLRQREADVGSLQQELSRAEGFLREREADVATLQAQLAASEGFLRQREADVRSLQQELSRAEGFLREREADVATLQAQLAASEGFLRQREADVRSLQQELGRAEGFLREREADVATLQAQLATSEGFLRQREADVRSLQQELSQAEGFLRDRERDVRVLQDEVATIQRFLRAREADIEALQERVAVLEQVQAEAESSWTWRFVRRLRRRFGWQRV